MTLQRYDMIVSQSGNHMQARDDGDWVDADEAQKEIDRLAGNIEYLSARSIEQAKLIAVLEHNLRAPFGAGDVRRLQAWLGVTGSIMTDESWEKLDDATRRLYVSEVVKVTEL
jgi:hypothetical protein